MSTTTQILFNSPALHSLKHEQLQKLCKIHSLKANGKKGDLIEKLKKHAKTLPMDDPLSLAARSEEDSEDTDADYMQKGGEVVCGETQPWEAMASIQEVDEPSTMGSRRTANEFGSSRSVGSSIKALASSLGLKRAMPAKPAPDPAPLQDDVKDDLAKISKPYSDLPPSDSLPSTDHFVLSTPDSPPLPGHPSRPGVEAPQDARLSLSALPSTPLKRPSDEKTTTIRLVSNNVTTQRRKDSLYETPQLRPFATKFDLDMGSPSSRNIWPQPELYPCLPLEEESEPLQLDEEGDMDVDMPGGFSSPRLIKPLPARASLVPPPALLADEPFVFGTTTGPRFSFASPTTAKLSVLEEMNARLANKGVQGLTSAILDQPKHTAEIPKRTVDSAGELYSRFDKAHQDQFNKMESIQSWADRKRARSPEKSGNGKKRKSSVMDDADFERSIKKVALPTAAKEEDDNDVSERRQSKRPRVSLIEPKESVTQEDKEEQGRKEKEREAIRRTLQRNKERRRSSMHARASGNMPPPPPKPKSAFRFLSSAKSLMASVWKGGGSKTAPAKSAAANTKSTSSMGPPPPKSSNKAIARPSASTRPSNIASRPPSLGPQGRTVANSSTSSRARSPLPFSFGTGASGSSSKGPVAGPSKTTRVSSLGTKGSSTNTGHSRTSSLGARSSLLSGTATSNSTSKRPSGQGAAPTQGSDSKKANRISSGSRLMAPTASSLAKMQATNDSSLASRVSAVGLTSRTGSSKVDQDGRQVMSPSKNALALEPITNGSTSPSKLPLPVGGLSKSPLPQHTSSAFLSPKSPDTTLDLNLSIFPKPPSNPPTKVLLRGPSGRKPRISRSKVIAKLASQRVASGSGTQGALKPRGSAAGSSASGATAEKRTRSSLGAGLSSKKAGVGRSSDISMSAKKKSLRAARQSEYLRRQSARAAASGGSGGGGMDVDGVT